MKLEKKRILFCLYFHKYNSRQFFYDLLVLLFYQRLGLCRWLPTHRRDGGVRNSIPDHREMEELSRSTAVEMETTIDAINDDLLHNILSRLPALACANAACVNRSWNLIITSLLSLPNLSSALSINPSLQVLVWTYNRVHLNSVFSTPNINLCIRIQ